MVSASADSCVEFILGIITRGAERRNWPGVEKMTGGR